MKAVKVNSKPVSEFKNEEVRRILKEERQKKGWSYEEMGKKLDVSASYMYRLESGQRENPSGKVVRAICEVFGVEPERLLNMEHSGNKFVFEGKAVNFADAQNLFKLALGTNVDKMSEVNILLKEIERIQGLYNE